MSILVNSVQLLGRLGADAEIKTTNQGTKVATYALPPMNTSKMQRGNGKRQRIGTIWSFGESMRKNYRAHLKKALDY